MVTRVRAKGARVLIVDDSSPDGTGRRADEIAATDAGVSVHHRPTRQGLGPAYADGFAEVLEHSPPAVCQMDADLSHDPADLPRLLAELEAGADVAIGSRYVRGGSTEGWSAFRRILSRAGNLYARLMLGLRTRDATAGYRAYRPEALARLDPATCEAAGYAFQVEMTWRAERAGLRIVEVPIRFTERRVGRSKMSVAIAVEAFRIIGRWGWLRWRGRLRSGL